MAYDLTPILEAIETIVNKKVSDAQYTKILTGKIKSQIQDNIYEVAFDNSSILAKTTGNIQLEINDTVKLLQINGAENVNENTFILGKSEDLARAGFDINVGELKNIVSIAGPATTTSLSWAQEININFSDSDINKIKKVLMDQQLCCLKAKFKLTDKFTQDHTNGHYGLKLIIQYTNTAGSKTVEEKLDIVDMVGEPYKFFNEVEQQKVFKLKLYNLSEINSVNLIAYTKDFGKASNDDIILEINDINFATVQYTEKGNKYTVELDGGSTRACFVSKTQQDINSYTLLAQVKKNDNNFVNKNLVYYWFKKNPSIKVGNDLYCSYGGEGWACLNKSYEQSIVAVGSTLKNAEKRKVWEDGGNKLIISEADTLQYHNYYKCVVVYNNDIVISSIEKDIINLDRNEINIYFNVVPNYNNFSSKENTFIVTINPTGENYIYNWYWLNENNVKTDIDISTDKKTEYTLQGSAVDIENNDYITLVCEINYKNAETGIEEFIGQASKVFYNNLTNQYQESVVYGATSTPAISEWESHEPETGWRNSINEDWEAENENENAYDYIFSKTTKSNKEEVIACYWARVDGKENYNGPFAKQITEFNNLTKGGAEQGIWFNTKENNKLLINANYIKTGSLDATLITVGALKVGELFKADIENPNVTIGGFTVNKDSLIAGVGEDRVGISTGDYTFWSGSEDPSKAPFRVTKSGEVSLTNVEDFATNYNITINKTDGLKIGETKYFQVGADGVVNWTKENTPVKYLYSSGIPTENPPAEAYSSDSYPDSIGSGSSEAKWHKVLDISKDRYYSMSASGQAGTFSLALSLQGKDGERGPQGPKGDSGYAKIVTIEGNTNVEKVISSANNGVAIINVKDGEISGGGGGEFPSLPTGNWSITVLGGW